MAATRPRFRFDTQRLAQDLLVRGWSYGDAARAASLHERTVRKFLHGEVQTTRTLRHLAKALGVSPARYLIKKGAAA